MTPRALITGCNGLLGTAITQRLNDMGCVTIGVTKDKQSPSLCFQTVYGSATDEELISSSFKDSLSHIHTLIFFGRICDIFLKLNLQNIGTKVIKSI